ncbi:uncharacterized protein [Hyperolius riggenbachi]|uniref:uncharacterized protein n=1 Tax=Hyperolius riggenbachi TaxID=752182 RepID=UPI0035A35679
MPTPGNGVDGECYGSPHYNTGIAAYPQQPVLVPYPNQQYHEPPPAYETIGNFPSLCANPVGFQLNVTPSAPVAENDVSYAPVWPTSHNGAQVHVPANAPQRNVQPTTTFNNIPYSAPTTSHLLVASAQNPAALGSQNTCWCMRKLPLPFRAIFFYMMVSAMVHIGLGIGIALASNQHARRSRTISCGIPFWGAILHIITGIINAAAHVSPPRCKISTAIILTIGTMIVGVIDLALNIKDFNDAVDCFVEITNFGGSTHVCFHSSPFYWGLIATNGFILFFSLILIFLGCILSNEQ